MKTAKHILLLLSIVMVFYSCDNQTGYKKPTTPQETQQPNINLYPIEQDGKFGYIDNTGKIIIEPQFDDFDDFIEEVAWVEIGENSYFINKNGQIVINSQFYLDGIFSEDYAIIRSRDIPDYFGGKYGYIDKSGKCVINPQFNNVENFHEDLACIRLGDKVSENLRETKIGKYGYIDKNGNIIISPQFDDAKSFSEGLAPVKIGEYYGYINKSGKTVINPQFDDAEEFSEGLAKIKISNKYGYIDKSGNIIINPQYEEAFDFREGLAFVVSNGKGGYIDNSGNYSIRPQFDYKHFRCTTTLPDGNNFSEGLAVVCIDNKCTFINKNGDIAIDQLYDWAEGFHNGLARIWLYSDVDEEETSCLIDKYGNIIWTDHMEHY